mgnify:FL=1
MKKIIALSIALLTFTAAACDEPATGAPVEFREGVNAEFPTIEFVGKIFGNCITIDRPGTITLVEGVEYADGTQSITVTLESIARVPDVDCLLGVLESNQ